MTKSTSILFILFFSIILKLEKKRISLIFVILFIACGLLMFTYKSTQFHLQGFLLCLSASMLSGIRWSTTQLFTQHDKFGLSHPIDMIYHVQPWMILFLLPLSSGIEGLEVTSSSKFFGFHNSTEGLDLFFVLLYGAILAFAMECTEYLMVSRTSSLTLCISGIIKEITLLGLAVKINKDEINSINFVGLIFCLLGISLHVIIKFRYSNDDQKVSRIEIPEISPDD
uniref:Slc35c-4 n=1 Tax=Schmidtea mediterranea TaxID=79327 RepID=A0A0H3YKF8_SCHMD|nr:slc35c-4 [Schmidtea mediterranea]